MELAEHAIGVADWSLGCGSVEESAKAIRALSLCHIHLGLGPLIAKGVTAVDDALKILQKYELTPTAGMIGFAGEDYTTIATIKQSGGLVPDALWEQRRSVLESAAKAAQRLNMAMVSTHVGFVPSSNEARYPTMVARMQDAASLFQSHGLMLLLETGQEGASELLQFLNDIARANVGINMDPANMILYGAGNPVDALRVLGRHVKHVHIKDAMASQTPGVAWGTEVPFGEGQVNALAFVESLRFGGYRGPLVIEREAGPKRMDDIRHAVAVLESILQPCPEADGE